MDLVLPIESRGLLSRTHELRHMVLILGFSIAFGLIAPWRDKMRTDLLLFLRFTYAASCFVPFLYLALRLYGRASLASWTAVAWVLWVLTAEVITTSLANIEDLLEDTQSYLYRYFWHVSLTYFILGAGLVMQPLPHRKRAAIGAVVTALKVFTAVAFALRVSEPLGLTPGKVLQLCLTGTAGTFLLGALAMSAAEHTRKTLPKSQPSMQPPEPQPTAQLQPHPSAVLQPLSSPNWLLALLLVAHAVPLVVTALACGLLPMPPQWPAANSSGADEAHAGHVQAHAPLHPPHAPLRSRPPRPDPPAWIFYCTI